jgi:hypothetical protein
LREPDARKVAQQIRRPLRQKPNRQQCADRAQSGFQYQRGFITSGPASAGSLLLQSLRPSKKPRQARVPGGASCQSSIALPEETWPTGAFGSVSQSCRRWRALIQIKAEVVLWPDQPEAYWLTVIADSLGSGRRFRFVRTHQE